MSSSDLYDLKKKILLAEPSRYWGDGFDVRYYVVSKLKETKNESILDSSFDHIVCCNILDFGKVYDLKTDKVIESCRRYPTVEHTLSEFRRALRTNGKLTLTVSNNAYYKASAFEYKEFKTALMPSFPDHALYFFNTLPKIGNSRR